MHEMGREVLELAKEYYFRHTTTSAEKDHVLLADIYGGLGSMDSETNNFQGTYNNFQSQWAELEAAFETGQIQRPSIMEVFGLGRVANGLMALNRFEQAEEYYRRCFHAWEGLPGDRLIWTSNMAKCLCLQHKLEEAETLLLPLLENRSDMSSFRFVVFIPPNGKLYFVLTYTDKAWCGSLHACKYQNSARRCTFKGWKC